MDKSSLPEPQPGDRIKADLIAELARRSSGGGLQTESFGDDYGESAQDRANAIHRIAWAQNATGVDIPAWSIFGIYNTAAAGEPPAFQVQKVGLNGALIGVFTNGGIPQANGNKFECYNVDTIGIFKVGVSGTLPAVGYPCGPHLGNFGITAKMTGFVCLTQPDANNIVSVVATAALNGIAGEVIGTPISSAIYTGGQLTAGNGFMSVMLREPSTDNINFVTDPVTGVGPYVVQVFNLEQVEVAVGTRTYADYRAGMGLVVQHPLQRTVAQWYLDRQVYGYATQLHATPYLLYPDYVGWVGSEYVQGDQALLGVVHDWPESRPDQNGNWLVTRPGRYRINLSGSLKGAVEKDTIAFYTNYSNLWTNVLGGPHQPSVGDRASTAFTTSQPLDRNTGNTIPTLQLADHIHLIEVKDYEYLIDARFGGPHFEVELMRKPAGGVQNTFIDGSPVPGSQYRRYVWQAKQIKFILGANAATWWSQVSVEWMVNLAVGDRLSLKVSNLDATGKWSMFTFDYNFPLRMIIERIDNTTPAWASTHP